MLYIKQIVFENNITSSLVYNTCKLCRILKHFCSLKVTNFNWELHFCTDKINRKLKNIYIYTDDKTVSSTDKTSTENSSTENSSTNNSSSTVVKPDKPVYTIGNLSDVIKKPKYNDPLYSALHGPTSNISSVDWYDLEKKLYPRNEEAIRQLPFLYLYHGKRFCVERENEDDSDVSLFHSTKDASLGMYDHQRIFQVWETVHGVEQFLQQVMGTENYPVLRLCLKNKM